MFLVVLVFMVFMYRSIHLSLSLSIYLSRLSLILPRPQVADAEKEAKKNAKLKDGEEPWDFAADTQAIIDSIEKSGLKHFCYKSVQEDEIYCLVGITERRFVIFVLYFILSLSLPLFLLCVYAHVRVCEFLYACMRNYVCT